MPIFELITIVVGILGSVASIVALFLVKNTNAKFIIHSLYLIFIGIFAVGFVWGSYKLKSLTSVENQAQQILRESDLNTDENRHGFMLKSLAFLETRKSSFPETYNLARQFCVNSGVIDNNQAGPVDRGQQFLKLQHGAGTMKHLLEGIAGCQK